LARRGYLYDATTFPTFLGPLARLYYFATARLSTQQKLQRKSLFGGFGEGLRPIGPYRWRLDCGELLEIPVTTMPVLKVPIHFSYLLYLSMLTPALAVSYFHTALRLCRLAGVQPSLLLHPLDFLGRDDVQDLSFFPGMGLPSQRKLQIVSELLGSLSDEYRLVTLRQHALEVSQTSKLAVLEPRFS
jgi:hypothetical protein